MIKNKLMTRGFCMAAAALLLIPNLAVSKTNISRMKRVKQVLVAPPGLPVHTQKAKGAPKIIEVRMVIEEKKIVIDGQGTEVWAFTYNGTVPGPMIVAHVNDYVEVTLVNPKTNKLVHNVDFHASTGALGGGGLTHVAPGEEVTLRWKAVKPGVFVYHCAPGGAMIPWHVVHGMNGAVMILPRNGLKDGKNGRGRSLRYDKAFYIGEQDFYIPKDKKGRYKKYKSPMASYADDMKVMAGRESNRSCACCFNRAMPGRIEPCFSRVRYCSGCWRPSMVMPRTSVCSSSRRGVFA